MAPNYLLAFARATVSEMVIKGGFPPFLLPLVDVRGAARPRGRSRRRHSRRRLRSTDRRHEPEMSPAAPGTQPDRRRPRLGLLGHGARRAPRAHRAPRRSCGASRPMSSTRWRGTGRNRRYLPGRRRLPAGVEIEHDFARAVAEAERLLIVVPSHAFREVLAAPEAAAATAASGWPGPPRASNSRPASCRTRWRAKCSAPSVPTAVLSGPTFAKEVGAGLPTAMTVASRDEDYALAARTQHHRREFPRLRVDRHDRCRGRRRHQERARDRRGHLGRPRLRRQHARRADHARPRRNDAARRRARRGQDTFMGLAGLGDLVLTCTDDQSRNRRFGLALAAGKPCRTGAARDRPGRRRRARRARRARGRAPRRRARCRSAEQIYRVLYEGLAPKDAVIALMQRTVKTEND